MLTKIDKKVFFFFTAICILTAIFPMFASASEISPSQNTYTLWFDVDDNPIIDAEKIEELNNLRNTNARAYVCCSNQRQRIYYYEEHFYDPPTPASCTYNRYREIFCDNCDKLLSDTFIGTYSHVHQ